MKLWITFLIVLFVSMVFLGMLASFGCVPENQSPTDQRPIFIQGEKVDLVLGGEAQVIETYTCSDGPFYLIRMMTTQGLQTIRIEEFELYLPLPDVDSDHPNVLEIR